MLAPRFCSTEKKRRNVNEKNLICIRRGFFPSFKAERRSILHQIQRTFSISSASKTNSRSGRPMSPPTLTMRPHTWFKRNDIVAMSEILNCPIIGANLQKNVVFDESKRNFTTKFFSQHANLDGGLGIQMICTKRKARIWRNLNETTLQGSMNSQGSIAQSFRIHFSAHDYG